jgi:hypothetical protein
MSFLSVAFAKMFIASYIYAKKLSGLYYLERQINYINSRKRLGSRYTVPSLDDIREFLEGYENAEDFLALLLKSFGPHMPQDTPQENNGSKVFVGALPDLRLQITHKCKNNRCSEATVSFDEYVDEAFYEQATDTDLKLKLTLEQNIEVVADSFTCRTCNQREGCIASKKWFINSNSPYLLCKLDASLYKKAVKIKETGNVEISISGSDIDQNWQYEVLSMLIMVDDHYTCARPGIKKKLINQNLKKL